ncbi:MAG: RluA family pseudouridine synthase [Clostridiales bacterium]|jgi:23S rRNA pseudouridine955/2504/2580 synthase|nr:RluA family pseudouridine synthase [Clostridiales bacterium]
MKEFVISENDAGKLIKFIQKTAVNMPESGIHKHLRKGRVRVNGACVRDGKTLIGAGDRVNLYVNDEFFAPIDNKTALEHVSADITIVFEDENLLIIDKPVGILAHEDEHENVNTMINRAKKYLINKGDYVPEQENQFAPALCHRLDRNTRGLLIVAKNAEILRNMNEIIKHRQVRKFYLCECFGEFAKPSDTLHAYLKRYEGEKRVKVFAGPVEGCREITTKYEVLSVERKGVAVISTVEVELVTGRTHQIRAHMAYIGCPLVGDEKYGNAALNKALGVRRQRLTAYKLEFTPQIPDGKLDYLRERKFVISNQNSIWER